MSTIKVECQCGQRYSFEVEPVYGRMPYPVACPICGADGTPAANEMLAQESGAAEQPMTYASQARLAALQEIAPSAGIYVGTEHGSAWPTAGTTGAQPLKLLPGQVGRPQAEAEGKAKIFWGDPPEEAIKFLMRNNFTHAEASELVDTWLDERAAATRGNGIGKIVTGSGMVCVPVVAWFIFASMGVIPLKLFALTVIVGLWGGYRVLKGITMVLAPRSETGDIADQ